MAMEFLSVNVLNRPIRESLVRLYASDMKEGRWRVTHQGIAFDEDNNLLDGQQRLSAIILAGVSIQMLVTYGVPRFHNEGIDIGARRNFADTAWFMGRLNGNSEYRKWYGIVARGMHVAAFTGRVLSFSIPAVLEWAKKHDSAITFALETFSRPHQFPVHVKCQQTLGSVARAFYSQDHPRLNSFANVLATGMPESEDDVAAIKLRNYLIQGTADYRQLRARKCARALMAFCVRERLTKLYDPGDPVFEIPE
jgi:hypothetical protein